MFNNKCFCEVCNRFENINVKNTIASKEFTVGEIYYEKLIGFCANCGNEIYSADLAKINKKALEDKIDSIESKVDKLIEITIHRKKRILSEEEITEEIEKMMNEDNKK